MDLSKVKLVVTDMDGTLLNSKGHVSTNFFHLYEQLKKYNVYFVAASGRQYQSIINKLQIIKDEIFIIAENGGLTVKGDKELQSVTLDPAIVQELIPEIRKIKNIYIVLCGKNSAYIETREEKFVSIFNEYYTKYNIVNDLTKVVDDDFFKIAIYHFECSEKYIYPSVKLFEDELQVKVSGENWVDISNANANKGNSLSFIQNKLAINKEETMVFGDYNNDLEMLNQASFSYAMENAHNNVKDASRFKTKSNDEGGVEYILGKLLDAKNISRD